METSYFLLFIIQLIAVLAVFYTTKQSVLDPTVWEDANPLPDLSGALSPNNLLSKDSVIHVGGGITGPESTAIDPLTGTVYASLNDGTVVSISYEGEKAATFFSPAKYVRGHNEEQSQSHTTWCREQRKTGKIPWHPPTEKKCGRPLGLRFRQVRFKLSITSSPTIHQFHL